MTTRLERLVSLLDTGSSQLVRRTAAEQLGEIQKLHPHELFNLLALVKVHLKSKSWDTRIAAGQAIEAIARHVPAWSPDSQPESSEESDDALYIQGKLLFKSFDIDRILEKGALLLASSGAEFDIDLTGMDRNQRLIEQRSRLRAKLGLDNNFSTDDGITEFFKDEDVAPNANISDEMRSRMNEEARGIANAATLAAELGAMSARERHQLKRKARLASKESTTSTTTASLSRTDTTKRHKTTSSIIVTDQSTVDKVVIESLSKQSLEGLDEWPFEVFCEQLCQDLFEPVWEIRHGAAIGLRDLMKVSIQGAGRSLFGKDNEKRHIAWLEDVAIRCLCLLCLDRFVDMSSDPAIAPVRETCAQALGALMKGAPLDLVEKMSESLLKLQKCPLWEVRHAGLLGIKYMLAIRQDLANKLLYSVLPSILRGLYDKDDDVRAVSSDALLPVTEQLFEFVPDQVQPLLQCLWNILPMEELTASVASVMNLLCKLLTSIHSHKLNYDLNECIPRLWPYLRDSMSIVRTATLTTLKSLVSKSDFDLSMDHLASTCRLLLQCLFIEEKEGLLEITSSILSILISKFGKSQILSTDVISIMFQLINTPLSHRLSHQLFIFAERRGTISLTTPSSEEVIGIPDPNIISIDILFRNRYIAAKGLSMFLPSMLCDVQNSFIYQVLNDGLFQSRIGSVRQLSAIILGELFKHSKESCESLIDAFSGKLYAILESADNIKNHQVSNLFYELQPFAGQITAECMALIHTLVEEYHIDRHLLPLTNNTSDPFTLAQQLMNIQHMKTIIDLDHKEINEAYNAKVSQLTFTLSCFEGEQERIWLSIHAAFAQAFMACGQIPDKLTPIIRSLMNSIKLESNAIMQERSGASLAELFDVLRTREKNPTNKILKNLISFLMQEDAISLRGVKLALNSLSKFFKNNLFHHLPSFYDILYTPIHEASQQCPHPITIIDDAKLDATIFKVIHDDKSHNGDNSNDKSHQLIKKEEISESNEPIQPIVMECKKEEISSSIVWEECVLPLRVMTLFTANLDESLHRLLCQDWLNLLLRLAVDAPDIRTSRLAAEAVAEISYAMTPLAMPTVLSFTLSSLLHDHIECRRGSMRCIRAVVERLETRIVPYLVLFILPVLGRTMDFDNDLRDNAVVTFARLVPLMPLESSSSISSQDSPLLSHVWEMRKSSARTFIEQLLDPTKMTMYELMIPIHADLRHYQRDGINWLGFLCRYQLHGILCDDMGLGKTLQTLCVIANEHFKERERNPTGIKRKSLVVCPPTVAGHWLQEIEKFICNKSILSGIIYMGTSNERALLRKTWDNYDVIILSYEVLRNDIEELTSMDKSYLFCVLDEGHMIKNPKTKTTIAVKRIQAQHRLILSGTPIQNNVLELWSLFDFLMPGFLGTENAFNERYAKPILASRDAKSSSKEQEAGTFALDRLHKQVLPFLLRRLKEDVLQDLPPKIIQDRYCDLSPLQVHLYEHFAKSQKSLLTNKNGNAQNMFTALHYLRKVCNHPALVLTPQHPQWQSVNASLTQQKKDLSDISVSPKLLALQEILTECGMVAVDELTANAVSNHRVLIFAQMRDMLDIVERDLFKKNMPHISYLRLDGSVEAKRRHNIVNQFNADPSIDVLLLTTHVGGLGLNLTGADIVIFIDHDWNPMRDLQAMDRAHRIGQKKVVNVYRLITRNTLEEKIMGLQKFKMHIATSVVNSDNASMQTMSTDHLLELFTISDGNGAITDKKEPSMNEEGEEGVGEKGTKSMARVLENLEELWDTKQYEEEYDVNAFVASFKK